MPAENRSQGAARPEHKRLQNAARAGSGAHLPSLTHPNKEQPKSRSALLNYGVAAFRARGLCRPPRKRSQFACEFLQRNLRPQWDPTLRHRSGRIPLHHRERRNRSCHDAAGRYDGAFTYDHSRQNQRSGPDKRITANPDSLNFAEVGEYGYAEAYDTTIFQRNCKRSGRIQHDVIPDPYTFSDVHAARAMQRDAKALCSWSCPSHVLQDPIDHSAKGKLFHGRVLSELSNLTPVDNREMTRRNRDSRGLPDRFRTRILPG